MRPSSHAGEIAAAHIGTFQVENPSRTQVKVAAPSRITTQWAMKKVESAVQRMMARGPRDMMNLLWDDLQNGVGI
jgi:hypothetical protein